MIKFLITLIVVAILGGVLFDPSVYAKPRNVQTLGDSPILYRHTKKRLRLKYRKHAPKRLSKRAPARLIAFAPLPPRREMTKTVNPDTLRALKQSSKLILEIDPILSGRFTVNFDRPFHPTFGLVPFFSVEDERLLFDPSQKNTDVLVPKKRTIGGGLGLKVKVTRMSDQDVFLFPNVYVGQIMQWVPESSQSIRKGLRTRVGLDLGWERAFVTDFTFSVKGGLARSFDNIRPFVKPELEYSLSLGVGYAFH